MMDMEGALMHHHRSTVKKNHKAFKSKHLSKSALRAKTKGKVEKSLNKLKPKHVESKQERRNKAKQIMLSKREEVTISRKIFDGRKGAPRIVAIIPLCPDIDSSEVVRSLNRSVDATADIPFEGAFTVPIERFKQKIQYVVPPRTFIALIDAAQIADFVVFVVSAKQEVDHFGETVLRTIVAQGVSTVYTIVQHLSEVESTKMQTELRRSLLSYMAHFFAEQEKVFSVEQPSECLNVVRSLCQQFPKGIQWRDSRAYILADRIQYVSGSLYVEGTVRGKKLNPDRLVHLPGFGDFQIVSIKVIEGDNESRDYESTLTPGADAEDLDEYAPQDEDLVDADMDMYEEPDIARGVRMDDHIYLSDEDDEEKKTLVDKHRVPKGMSEYQARWILEENSDDEFDKEASTKVDDDEDDYDDNVGMDVEYDRYDVKSVGPGDIRTEYDAQSEMFVELAPEEEARQLKEYREREKEDNEFPDEIELPPEVSAKERLNRYRGMKNLRLGDWDSEEKDTKTPEGWDLIFRFQNYKGTRNRVLKEVSQGRGVSGGLRVIVEISIPEHIAQSFGLRPFFPIYSLLRYEHKKVVLNVTATPNTEYEEPIPTKDDLILQCGPRRYSVKPIFSETGTAPNNVFKMSRFLHQGQTAMATMIAPIAFGNVPTVFLKETEKGIELVAYGSVDNADHSRIVTKRIILTGYPFKIHKRLVTVRYMFFNSEDVSWFKAVPLFTKMGRTGYIKESLGTHGYFKCTFNGPINPQDTVAMSLYKRLWPRQSQIWQPCF
ncbi:hypothetical protein V1511DRAFT_503270 [Dipodascopsis uninucleata]